MEIHRLTLDTNILREFWDKRSKYKLIKKLLALADEGKVDLAVTARIRDDIPRIPLSERINNLPLLNITETGAVFRLDVSQLDRDFLGDDVFVEWEKSLNKTGGKEYPDWRDWDHIHAHYLLKRDFFLTWDKHILGFTKELNKQFGIVVMKPEDYFANLLR